MPVRARRLADGRRRIRAAAALHRRRQRALHALPRSGRPGGRGRRPRGRPAGRGEELDSPYVEDELLDLGAWAQDALALAMPVQVLCREDCAGLCPVCAADLNEAGPEHHHEQRARPPLGEAARAATRVAGASLLLAFPRMAVPKKKQSHSRTAKRRAQHQIDAPAINACPQCHSPRRPHRVCPVCGTYAGREVVSAGATSTSTITTPEAMGAEGAPGPQQGAGGRRPVVAVDGNGADLGPGEVAAGAALRGRARRADSAVRAGRELGEPPEGVEVVDAPISIAKAPDPVRAVRATPEASIVQGGPRGRRRTRPGARLRRRDRRRAGGRDLQHQARARASTGRRWR